MESIKQALLAAFKKDHPDQFQEDAVYDIDLDSQTGEARIYLIDGKKTDITPPGYGRIAAQTAKQVILQKSARRKKSPLLPNTKTPGILGQWHDPALYYRGNYCGYRQGRSGHASPRAGLLRRLSYQPEANLYLDSIRDGIRGKEIVVSPCRHWPH